MKSLVILVLVTLLCLDNVQSVRLCGKRLADLLNFICEKHGGFHAPKSRRSGIASSRDLELEGMEQPRRSTEEGGEEDVPALRGGVVDECCRKQCSLSTLTSYCARHVGDIDLDEILPPGIESVSESELVQYQKQQDTPTECTTPPCGVSNPSRSNMGHFRRNRPVFIVLMPQEEQRALGEYRF